MTAVVAAYDDKSIARCRCHGLIRPGRILGLAGTVFRPLGRLLGQTILTTLSHYRASGSVLFSIPVDGQM